MEQLRRYQRQTSGFLMALVTQLCFGGHEAPQPEAVKHIISQYIMHESVALCPVLFVLFGISSWCASG